MRLRILLTAVLVAGLVVLQPLGVEAQRGMSTIRDAEIESIIRRFATPIFQAAGLRPSVVEIYLVNDKSINAFVAGGQKLFINTGLLMQSDSANQVIGVIAHEVGHIQGAHLARTHDAMRNATVESILAMVVGVAASVAAGKPEGIGAAMATGQEAGLRGFLHYSRTQESAADAAATRLLDATGQSAEGLLEFLRKLEDQELLVAGRRDPYLLSHPLARDRISALEAFVGSKARRSSLPSDEEAARLHRRMVAKLVGFLEPFPVVMRRYPPTDTSFAARYARAVALYRKPDLTAALAAVDDLIREAPSDPYLYELKGQMLFEGGRPGEALAPYRTAAELAPGAASIRIELARVELALNDPGLIDDALRNLQAARTAEPRNVLMWNTLGEAYHRQGEETESLLARAEATLLEGRYDEAIYHANRAQQALSRGSPGWLQAADIAQQAERRRDEQRRDGR